MLTLVLTAALSIAPQAGQVKPATNTICPVLGGKVDPKKSPKVVVRGQEYYICCKGCDKELAANPDKFLEKDGTPKNAKKAK
ncbi:hypothetical protein [Mesoterricola sediminis]|uniref:TRASH domain-containing protein n=1 Tax=Mesoterricola sediminis TaxID=2927980 RepID=A0AA48GXC7_9BACT|nr:hypothetical protein [Mesoterricola sediminis]BDU78014.1 hypothetical protein METESE_29720 [Mesoterricola sediminis]